LEARIRDSVKEQSRLTITDRVESAIREKIAFLAGAPGAGHRRQDLTEEHVKFFPVYSYLTECFESFWGLWRLIFSITCVSSTTRLASIPTRTSIKTLDKIEVYLLKQVNGVGTQIALTYVLTIEGPYR
jgi:hypothetical protein